MKDEIVDEVRKNRTEILESYDWDILRMMRDMIANQKLRGYKVVTLEKRQPMQDIAANTYPLRGDD